MALCEDLLHTATGTAFADIAVGGHRETWLIRSKRFRSWLRPTTRRPGKPRAQVGARPARSAGAIRRPGTDVSGEQGSAKTVLSKLLKALIDPSAAPVRALSREERELMIAANNGDLLAFDNLSGLHNWLSDALCRTRDRR